MALDVHLQRVSGYVLQSSVAVAFSLPRNARLQTGPNTGPLFRTDPNSDSESESSLFLTDPDLDVRTQGYFLRGD